MTNRLFSSVLITVSVLMLGVMQAWASGPTPEMRIERLSEQIEGFRERLAAMTDQHAALLERERAQLAGEPPARQRALRERFQRQADQRAERITGLTNRLRQMEDGLLLMLLEVAQEQIDERLAGIAKLEESEAEVSLEAHIAVQQRLVEQIGEHVNTLRTFEQSMNLQAPQARSGFRADAPHPSIAARRARIQVFETMLDQERGKLGRLEATATLQRLGKGDITLHAPSAVLEKAMEKLAEFRDPDLGWDEAAIYRANLHIAGQVVGMHIQIPVTLTARDWDWERSLTDPNQSEIRLTRFQEALRRSLTIKSGEHTLVVPTTVRFYRDVVVGPAPLSRWIHTSNPQTVAQNSPFFAPVKELDRTLERPFGFPVDREAFAGIRSFGRIISEFGEMLDDPRHEWWNRADGVHSSTWDRIVNWSAFFPLEHLQLSTEEAREWQARPNPIVTGMLILKIEGTRLDFPTQRVWADTPRGRQAINEARPGDLSLLTSFVHFSGWERAN